MRKLYVILTMIFVVGLHALLLEIFVYYELFAQAYIILVAPFYVGAILFFLLDELLPKKYLNRKSLLLISLTMALSPIILFMFSETAQLLVVAYILAVIISAVVGIIIIIIGALLTTDVDISDL